MNIFKIAVLSLSTALIAGCVNQPKSDLDLQQKITSLEHSIILLTEQMKNEGYETTDNHDKYCVMEDKIYSVGAIMEKNICSNTSPLGRDVFPYWKKNEIHI